MEGQEALREPLAAFLAARVTRCAVAPAELVCTTGVGAALSHLFFSLCEEGDAVLIPAPCVARAGLGGWQFRHQGSHVTELPVEGAEARRRPIGVVRAWRGVACLAPS